MGCDGGVLNGNAHHVACPGRVASGGEWPICPVNIHLTRGHSGGLQGDDHPYSELCSSGLPYPPPTEARSALLTPLLSPFKGTSTLSVLKNNDDANNLRGKKGNRIHWVGTKPGFALTSKMATHHLFGPLA